MSWHETHERSHVLREVDDAIAAHPGAGVPWHESWALLFGDADGLMTFLRSRWSLRLADQADLLHPAVLAATRGLALLDREEQGLAAAS